jgi:hypothetical protein
LAVGVSEKHWLLVLTVLAILVVVAGMLFGLWL